MACSERSRSNRTNESWSTVSTHQETESSHIPNENQVYRGEQEKTAAQHEQPHHTPSSMAPSAAVITQNRADPECSDHSNVAPMEIEGIPSLSSGSASWIQRVPWVRRKRDRSKEDGVYLPSLNYQNGEAVYVGGTMETERHRTTRFRSDEMSNELGVPQIQKVASHLTQSSAITRSEDSLADFQPSEWTPQDSSYGAAIPVAGWIPKHIRRTIEWTLIGLGVVGLAFVIVTTSMRITDGADRSHNQTTTGGIDYEYDGGTGLDDTYAEYTDDDYASRYNSYNTNDDDFASWYGNDGNDASSNYDNGSYGDYNNNANSNGNGNSNGNANRNYYYRYYSGNGRNYNNGDYYSSGNGENYYTDDYYARR